ncbi:MAG: tetratricopeptide repeat protein [Candidatus Cloacimonadales bacterium]|nr:tetratricopeptide repeat protein [Candidatus Cloacimonadales bacterium]
MNETERIKNELENVPYDQKIRILQDLCRKYENKSDEDFLHYGQLLLLNIRRSDISPEICDLCNAVSNILQSKSNYLKALAYAKDTLDYSELIGYPNGLIKAYSKISDIQTVLSNYQEALDAAFNALRINEHLGDKSGISYSCNNIGIIYNHIKNYDSALEYFLKSLQQKEELDDQKGIITTYRNLSLICMNLGDLDNAVSYGEKVLSYNLAHNDQEGLSHAYANLGSILLQKGEIRKSIEFQKKSLAIKELTDDKLRISSSLQGIGECYLKLNNYEKAITYFERALQLVTEIKSLEVISDLALQLATCYERLNDYSKAYQYHKIYSDAKDEVLNTENQIRIAELHAKYEIEKKEKENEFYRLKNVELAKANATKDKFFSIISHDLRSPFATIQSFINLLRKNIEVYTKSDILELTEDLDKNVKSTLLLLENLLSWAMLHTNEINYDPQSLNLSALINETISSLAYNIKQKQLSVDSWVSENLVMVTDADMLKTILRNLLSNSIKFSFTRGKIIFSAIEKDDSIEISIKDSGTGMSREKISGLFEIGSKRSQRGTANEKGSGLGLILCREFAELCGGSISVESVENKGSIFTLNIPEEKK